MNEGKGNDLMSIKMRGKEKVEFKEYMNLGNLIQ